jgi:ribA/ribD-fused uncharacterized protein
MKDLMNAKDTINAPASQRSAAHVGPLSWTLDAGAAALLRDTIGAGEAQAITLSIGPVVDDEGSLRHGLRVHLAEHAEEGPLLLQELPPETSTHCDDDAGGLHRLDTAHRIRFYENDHYCLSNFSSFSLRWKGHTFPTSEHVYHWEKFRGVNGENELRAMSLSEQILHAPSAHVAFKLAEASKAVRRPDWDEVKVDVMRGILRAKAHQHEYVHRKLLASGDRELVEDSWRDGFWGWGPDRKGLNMLGRLWMEVRAELRI